jgi:release factor glutamine methyltransferase
MADIHQLRTKDLIPSAPFQSLNKHAEALAKSCQQASVPSLNHLKLADYNLVYEPSDDTFLMLDALHHEFNTENNNRQGTIKNILEIGSGTGVSIVSLGKMLKQSGNSDLTLYATDVNQEAVRITMQTALENGLDATCIKAIKGDLAGPVLEILSHKVDVLIFNPPYVPTPESEVGSEGIEASWAGGKDGRVVIDRAIPQIAKLLSIPNGVAYMVVVDDNKPEEIANLMMESYNIKVVPFLRRRARNEFLTILKCTVMVDEKDLI